ncbi:MAG TPA: hypothetical protein VE423_11985 [Microvirga sp.]|nr:hypothetical protein [Microvirga sp.]
MNILRLFGLRRLAPYALLLAALTAQASAEPTSSALPAEARTIAIGSYIFPRIVGDMSRISKTDYNSDGLGFSVRYRREDDTWADVYIYDRSRNLRSGSALSHARSELVSALEAIDEGVSRGDYERADILDRSVSGAFAKAHLTVVRAGATRYSYVFITVHKGNFVKIRLTSGDRRNADAIASRFLKEYSRVLGKT